MKPAFFQPFGNHSLYCPGRHVHQPDLESRLPKQGTPHALLPTRSRSIANFNCHSLRPAGTFTNQIQKYFSEPRLLIVADPRTDHQPVKETAHVNIPCIALCDTDSPLRVRAGPDFLVLVSVLMLFVYLCLVACIELDTRRGILRHGQSAYGAF